VTKQPYVTADGQNGAVSVTVKGAVSPHCASRIIVYILQVSQRRNRPRQWFTRVYWLHQERVRGSKVVVEKLHEGGTVVAWHFLFCIKLDNYSIC